jgi:hypothetical protein
MPEDLLLQYDLLIRNREALAAMLSDRKGLSSFLFLTDRMADEIEALRDRIAELDAFPSAAQGNRAEVGTPRDPVTSCS